MAARGKVAAGTTTRKSGWDTPWLRGKCIAQRQTAKEYRTSSNDSPPPFRRVSQQHCCLRHPRRECSTPQCGAFSRLVAPHSRPTSPPPPSAFLSRTAHTAPVLVLRPHTPATAVAALGNGRCGDNGEKECRWLGCAVVAGAGASLSGTPRHCLDCVAKKPHLQSSE